MAAQKNEQPVASHKIAEERGIKPRFLLKVLKPLVDEGVLRSIKGPNGGYQLARSANDISMLDIVEAVEGRIRGHTAFDSKNNPTLNNKIVEVCNQSAEAIRKTLEKVRVSDLVGKAKK
jgi:Rrf2 family protein